MTKLRLCLRAASLAFLACAFLVVTVDAQSNADRAVVIGQISGIINPATATYVDRVITDAERANAPAVVLSVDSPGGLTNAMSDINQRIERSTVAVLVDRGGVAYDARLNGVDPPSTGVGSATPIVQNTRDVSDLLRQVNGATVQTASGSVTLQTANAPIRSADMSPTESFMHALAIPTIAYILLSVGSLGLLLELLNPGSVFPGVVGGICLVLAFYALGSMPLNFTGVALVALGLLLFALEPFLTAHGILAVGGAVAFVIGSTMLINAPDAPYLQIAPVAIGAVTAVLAGFFLVLVGFILRIRRRRAITGREGLVGARGVVRRDIEPRRQGMVFVQGELWRANATSGRLIQGEEIVVERVDGLVLIVRRANGRVPAPRPASPAEAKSKAAGV
ncbi:MAG TPA: NfeD family protein [Chloroflexota bacterium]